MYIIKITKIHINLKIFMLCNNKFQNIVISGKKSLSFLFFFWLIKWLDKFSFVYFLWLTFLWVRTFFIIFFSWKMFDLSLKNTSLFFKNNTELLVYFSKDDNLTSIYFSKIINRLLFENFYKNLNNGFWSVFYKFSRIRPLFIKRRRAVNFFKPFFKLKRLTFFFRRTKHNIFRKILKSYFLFICLVFFIGARKKNFRRFLISSRSFKLQHFFKVIINYCIKKRPYYILFLSFFRLFGKKFLKVSHYVYKYLKYFSISFLKYFFNRYTAHLNSHDFMQLMSWKNKYLNNDLIKKFPFEKKRKFLIKSKKSYLKKIRGFVKRRLLKFRLKNQIKIKLTPKKKWKIKMQDAKKRKKINKFYLKKFLDSFGFLDKPLKKRKKINKFYLKKILDSFGFLDKSPKNQIKIKIPAKPFIELSKELLLKRNKNLHNLISRIKKTKHYLSDIKLFKLLSWSFIFNIKAFQRTLVVRHFLLSFFPESESLLNKNKVKPQAKNLYNIYILYAILLKKILKSKKVMEYFPKKKHPLNIRTDKLWFKHVCNILRFFKYFEKLNKSKVSNEDKIKNISNAELKKVSNEDKIKNISNAELEKVKKGTIEVMLMKKPFLNQYNFVGFVLDYFGLKNNPKFAKEKYLKFAKGLKTYYPIYKKEFKKKARLNAEFKKKYQKKLLSIFDNKYDLKVGKKLKWQDLNFKHLEKSNYKLLFLDRFFILRNFNKFYLKLRQDFYNNFLYNKGISFKLLKTRIEHADLQDKEAPIDKTKKNTVIIENKDRNKFVYYKKGQIIIQNKNKTKLSNSVIIEQQDISKNKIILDTSIKNKIIIDNTAKDKRVIYDKNNIVIEIRDKKKSKNRGNDLEQPVALILKKPLFGFFLNSLVNNISFLNFAFLSQAFKKLLFFISLKNKRLSVLTSFDSGINGFFIPFAVNQQYTLQNTQYGFFVPYLKDSILKMIKKSKNLKSIKRSVFYHLSKQSFFSLKDIKKIKNKWKSSAISFFKFLYRILLKYGLPFGRFVSENAKNVMHQNSKPNWLFYKTLWVLLCKFLYKDKSFLLSLRPIILNKFFVLIQKTNKIYNLMACKHYYLPFLNKSISKNHNEIYNKFITKYHIYKNIKINNPKFLEYKKAKKFKKLASRQKYYNFFFKTFYAKYIPFEKSKIYKRLQRLRTSKKHYHKYIIRKYTSKYCRFSYFFKYLFKSKNKRFKKRLTKRAYCYKRLRRLKKGIKKFNKRKAKKLYKKVRRPALRFWLRKLSKSVVSVLRKQLISFFFGINTLILNDLFFNKKAKFLHHFFFLHSLNTKRRYKKFPVSIYMPGEFVSYKFNNYMKYDNIQLDKKYNLKFFTVKRNALNYHKTYNINSLNFFY